MWHNFMSVHIRTDRIRLLPLEAKPACKDTIKVKSPKRTYSPDDLCFDLAPSIFLAKS